MEIVTSLCLAWQQADAAADLQYHYPIKDTSYVMDVALLMLPSLHQVPGAWFSKAELAATFNHISSFYSEMTQALAANY